jgi:two-component SAPR family response regulator
MQRPVEGLRVVLRGSEEQSLAWLKKSLIRQGALVCSVESPKRALRLLRDYRMHVLIVNEDTTIDTASFMDAVRQLPSKTASSLTVIFLSDHDLTNITRIGSAHYIQKPVSLEGVLDVIQNTLA